MSSDSAFDKQFATVGSFQVMTGDNYSGSCVKVVCELDDAEFSRKAVAVLSELQYELTLSVDTQSRFDVNGKILYLKGTGRKEMCYWTWVRADGEKVEAWLKEREADLPVATSRRHVINTESLSVGPCSFEDADGRFVKVRFDKISVPFYFNKSTKTWDEATTNVHVVKYARPNLGSSIMEAVRANLPAILGRAVERPLNHSYVSEYGAHRLEYFEKLTVRVLGKDVLIFKKLQDADRLRMARPDFEPVMVFDYSASHEAKNNKARYFANIDDKLFSVVGFVNPFEQGDRVSKDPTVTSFECPANSNPQQYKYSHYRFGPRDKNTRDGGTHPSWLGPLAVLLPSDVDPIDLRDEYVKEKITRALKLKL